MKKINFHLFSLVILLTALGCTFDYGELESSERTLPDMIMENVDYVRIRSSDPIARIQAERVERYEKQGIMKLQNFTFEQFGERGEEVNASGMAGLASVDIESGDISMVNGVKIDVESEDIIIETFQLDWKDETRLLSSGEDDDVFIFQENGTSFKGIGLRVDTRRRDWEFTGIVSGTYIFEDDDEADSEDVSDENN